MVDDFDLDKMASRGVGDTWLIREGLREGGKRAGREGGKCTHLLCGVCSKIGPKVGWGPEGRMGEGRTFKEGRHLCKLMGTIHERGEVGDGGKGAIAGAKPLSWPEG